MFQSFKSLSKRRAYTASRPQRGRFESLEGRFYLSITPAVEVFDESMIFHEGGDLGSTIEAQNIAQNLKIVLEGVETFEDLEETTVINGALAHFDAEGRVHVSITLATWSQSLLENLENVGLETSVELEAGMLVEGWIAPLLVEDLAEVPGVDWVGIPEYLTTNVGAATSEGDEIVRALDVRTEFSSLGIDGSGVKIGVISDGAASRATSIASGDLPSSLIVNNANDGDEGTAMLEIVHDLAPGASLYFVGAHTVGELISGMSWLLTQNVDIIVDDLLSFGQQFFTDGALANAAAAVVSSGTTYITSSGNYAQQHYQAQFSQGSFFMDGYVHRDSSGDEIFGVAIPGREVSETKAETTIYFQWPDAWGASSNNYEILVSDDGINWGFSDNKVNQTGAQNPFESHTFENTSTSPVVRYFAIWKPPTAPNRELEVFVNNSAGIERIVTSDSVFGHQAVESVITVGAVNASSPTTLESFSNRGNSTIYTNFSTQAKVSRQSLDGVSVDGVETTVTNFTYFEGTSAAAPHVAAIAALLLDYNPSLTPAQISQILHESAVDIGSAGYDINTGFGRFDAYDAILAAPILGDYNGDGVVNAADYVVWRDTDGSTQGYLWWVAGFGGGTATLPGDANSDGTVNNADYGIWEEDFGSTSSLDADFDGDGIVGLSDFAVWKEFRNVTIETVIAGDFDGNGVVDMADLMLWEAQDPLADADEDMDVDQDDYDIWEANFGVTYAAVFPLTLLELEGPPARIINQAPHITEVTISGSASTHDPYSFSGVTGSGAQLQTVPVGKADTVHISFSEEVLVTSGSLTLTNIQGYTMPSLDEFTYDQETRTATWVFDGVLPTGQYLIQLSDSIFDLDRDALDGEFTNPWSVNDAADTTSELPSGDGEAGGEFRFRFTILPGDFNHDNLGNAGDLVVWADHSSMTTGATHGDGDGDGDGDVDLTDRAYALGIFGVNYQNWESDEPGMILVSTATDESDANYTYGDVSLREALLIAAANGGHDTIVFRQDLWDSTLTLTMGQLVVGSDVTIAGPGSDRLAISGDDASRVFSISSGYGVTIQDVTITEGYVSNSNGGAIASAGDLTLRRVVVSDSLATGVSGSNGAGGGIYSSAGSLIIVDSEIEYNESYLGGGIAKHGGGTGQLFQVIGSTIAYNETSQDYGAHAIGAGIRISTNGAMDVLIVNSTISNNTGVYGAGMEIRGSASTTVEIVNSTVAYNTAYGTTSLAGPGGIRVDTVPVYLRNSIVAANTSNSNGLRNVSGLNADGSYNLIGQQNTSPGLTGSGNLVNVSNTNAGLDALDYYGGLTKTHALLETSYALDAGNSELARGVGGVPLTHDQRGAGFIRVAGTSADIGAYEYEEEEQAFAMTASFADDDELQSAEFEPVFTIVGNAVKEAQFAYELSGGGILDSMHPFALVQRTPAFYAEGLRPRTLLLEHFHPKAIDESIASEYELYRRSKSYQASDFDGVLAVANGAIEAAFGESYSGV